MKATWTSAVARTWTQNSNETVSWSVSAHSNDSVTRTWVQNSNEVVSWNGSTHSDEVASSNDSLHSNEVVTWSGSTHSNEAARPSVVAPSDAARTMTCWSNLLEASHCQPAWKLMPLVRDYEIEFPVHHCAERVEQSLQLMN